MFQNDIQVGLSDQQKTLRHGLLIIILSSAQAQGAHFDLALRLFPRNVEHPAVISHLQRHLQQEG